MKTIRFVGSGLLGDFIHGLAAIKNICLRENALADVYISDGYFGDVWKYGAERAFLDLKGILLKQDYIQSVSYLEGLMEGEFVNGFINVNDWRPIVAKTHAETGRYNTCWSELMAQTFNYPIPEEYAWLKATAIERQTYKKTVIHRSKHRHNGNFNWEAAINPFETNLFVTTDKMEWDVFPYKHRCLLYLAKDIQQMVNAIHSADKFIGNQSAPFAIACALDVPRLVELDTDPAPFYIGEEKYSKNIKWFLNEEVNNL